MKAKIEEKQAKKGFKLRGLENTRIESLSDGVFAIAIGLLLISTSPPQSFDELMNFLQDFIPFAGTVSLLMFIWYQHYLFFIRFGLRDPGTIAINTGLLFLVLFYTYPLKFMIGLLADLYQALFTGDKEMLQQLFTEVIDPKDAPTLMVVYGLGASAIFIVFVWLNKRALKKQKELELSEIEIQLTKNTITMNIASGAIPLASALFAFFNLGGTATFMISGFMYMAYMIVMPLTSKFCAKKLLKYKAAE